MNSIPRYVRTMRLVVVALVPFAFTSKTEAVTVTNSASTPTVDSGDIANLDTTSAFDDFGSSFLWSDRPARGQTFTTGANPGGYLLDSLTVMADRNATGTSNYSLRIGSISGNAFTTVGSETGSATLTISENDFVTFSLATAVLLAPNTSYGFDVGMTGGSGGGFSTRGWGLVNNPQSTFTAGSAYSTGSNGVGGPTINTQIQDRIFHLNLEPFVVIPEPQTVALAAIGLLGLIAVGWRRRRR